MKSTGLERLARRSAGGSGGGIGLVGGGSGDGSGIGAGGGKGIGFGSGSGGCGTGVILTVDAGSAPLQFAEPELAACMQSFHGRIPSEVRHARTKDRGACAKGQTAGQSADDAGRRVRARGDGAHPRGEAWCPIDETGDRNRPLEGPALRRQAEATAQGSGIGTHPQERDPRVPRRPARGGTETICETVARHAAGAQARAAPCRVSQGALETGALGSHAAPPPRHGLARNLDGSQGSRRGVQDCTFKSNAAGPRPPSTPLVPPGRATQQCAGSGARRVHLGGSKTYRALSQALRGTQHPTEGQTLPVGDVDAEPVHQPRRAHAAAAQAADSRTCQAGVTSGVRSQRLRGERLLTPSPM